MSLGAVSEVSDVQGFKVRGFTSQGQCLPPNFPWKPSYVFIFLICEVLLDPTNW